MSKYENIIPDNVQTNTFEYRSATIELEIDKPWGGMSHGNSLIKAQWHQQITLLLFLIL